MAGDGRWDMARGTVTTDETAISIAMVRAALARLRELKPFRGQSVLVADAEAHLAGMMAAQGAGHAEPGWPPVSADAGSAIVQDLEDG